MNMSVCVNVCMYVYITNFFILFCGDISSN